MPVLRQPHDHHRDLRARLRAEVPPHTAGSNQDRHVMMPSPLIYTYGSARHPCRLSAGTAQARITALHSIAVARPILSFYPQIARSHRRMRPCSAARPIAATASIQPQQAPTCGKIPITHAAPPTLTSRDFVPWRFSDAGRRSAWIASSCRHPKTCTLAVIS